MILFPVLKLPISNAVHQFRFFYSMFQLLSTVLNGQLPFYKKIPYISNIA